MVQRAAAAAKKRAGPIPPLMHGVWAVESTDCDNPNGESRLVVDDRIFLFFVTAYDVKRMEKRRDGAFRASGYRSDEGERGKTRAALTVKLVSSDRITVMGSGFEDRSCDRCKGRSSAASAPLIDDLAPPWARAEVGASLRRKNLPPSHEVAHWRDAQWIARDAKRAHA